MSDPIQRFDKWQRLQHTLGMLVFTLLVVTGLPQKFSDAAWARAVLGFFGGVNLARYFHRAAGVAFAVLVVVHFGKAAWGLLGRKVDLSMVFTRKDLLDASLALRHQLGLTPEHPRYDRFEYKQKFEYWGLVLGGMIMIVTGLILMYPTWATRLMPGDFIPMSKVAHGNEAVMATLVIVFWHMYNAHLAPEVFPFDRSIFTGKISRERMEHEHPLELARLEAQAKAATPAQPTEPPAPAPGKEQG